MRHSSRERRGGTLAIALAVGLLGTACSSDVSYTYVDVEVDVDTASLDADHLYLVTSCEFFVMGVDESPDGHGLPCRENNVPAHVGTFQWASQAAAGTLQFTVKLFDANHVVLGAGTSDPVGIAPGKHLETSVLVLGVDEPDPGPGVDAGASDTNATDSASSDAGVD